MAWLLALDGATEQLALALVSPDGPVHAHEQAGGALASSTLVPAVQALLAAHDVRSCDVAAIGFGRGPGAFTGLRAVCAVVQGLAWGWNCPVVAVDSLLIAVEAAAWRDTASHWGAVMDARMGQCYAARYVRGSAGWQCVEAPALWDPDALRQAWAGLGPAPLALAGNAVGVLGGSKPQPPSSATPCAAPRAAALGRLCRQAWQRGDVLDAAAAMPLYVRDKVALTTAERAGQGAAA